MGDYKVLIMPIAKSDMSEMVDYLNKLDPQASINTYDKIIREIMTLQKFPNRYPHPKEESLRTKGYRILKVEKYLVFYVVKGKNVEIRRVLHEKRNYKSIL